MTAPDRGGCGAAVTLPDGTRARCDTHYPGWHGYLGSAVLSFDLDAARADAEEMEVPHPAVWPDRAGPLCGAFHRQGTVLAQCGLTPGLHREHEARAGVFTIRWSS